MKEIIIGYKEHKPGEPDPLWTAWEQTGELIRCKDCKHYRYYGLYEEIVSECRIDRAESPDGDWFCADGERK